MGGAPEVPGGPPRVSRNRPRWLSRWAIGSDDPDPNSASLGGHGGSPMACGGLLSQTNKVVMSLSPEAASLATASEGRSPAMASMPLRVCDALLMSLTAGAK